VRVVATERLAQRADASDLFMKLYANLPLQERKQVVLVLENEPISWDVARAEITHNSKKGGLVLSKLLELKIL